MADQDHNLNEDMKGAMMRRVRALQGTWEDNATTVLRMLRDYREMETEQGMWLASVLLSCSEDLFLGLGAAPGVSTIYTLMWNEVRQIQIGWNLLGPNKFEYFDQDLLLLDRQILRARLSRLEEEEGRLRTELNQ